MTESANLNQHLREFAVAPPDTQTLRLPRLVEAIRKSGPSAIQPAGDPPAPANMGLLSRAWDQARQIPVEIDGCRIANAWSEAEGHLPTVVLLGADGQIQDRMPGASAERLPRALSRAVVARYFCRTQPFALPSTWRTAAQNMGISEEDTRGGASLWYSDGALSVGVVGAIPSGAYSAKLPKGSEAEVDDVMAELIAAIVNDPDQPIDFWHGNMLR